MALAIDENVIRFDVPVDVVHSVHFLDGQDELCNIETSFRLREDILFDKQPQQVASRHPLHRNIQILIVLKGRPKLHKPLRLVS